MSKGSETQECGNCEQAFAWSDDDVDCPDRIIDVKDLRAILVLAHAAKLGRTPSERSLEERLEGLIAPHK